MNATVGNTINSVAIDTLPSLGRDVSTFVELQPGVPSGGQRRGAVYDQNYFSLDGGNNTNDMDGNMNIYTATYAGDPTGGVATQNNLAEWAVPTGVMPTPQDSVEEFKVNTAGQTADFNSSAGAEVKVVTKRGTNAWHGTATSTIKTITGRPRAGRTTTTTFWSRDPLLFPASTTAVTASPLAARLSRKKFSAGKHTSSSITRVSASLSPSPSTGTSRLRRCDWDCLRTATRAR